MKYKVIPTPNFESELKQLAKRYASIKSDVTKVVSELEVTPNIGTALGKGVYKIRMAIKSKNKGKSGGGRIITYFLAEDKTVHLLSIYDKSDFDSIGDNDIINLLRTIS